MLKHWLTDRIHAYGASDMLSSTDFWSLVKYCRHVRAVNHLVQGGSLCHIRNRFFCFWALYIGCVGKLLDHKLHSQHAPHMSSNTTFPSSKWLSNTVWEYIVTKMGKYRVRSSSLAFWNHQTPPSTT